MKEKDSFTIQSPNKKKIDAREKFEENYLEDDISGRGLPLYVISLSGTLSVRRKSHDIPVQIHRRILA